MNGSLSGKVVVITGGARNIGRRLVERLAEEGASIWFCDIRDQDGAAVESALRAKGCAAAYVHVDLRQPAAIEALAQQAAASTGNIDVWIHNATLDIRRRVTELTAAEWDDVQAVTLRAAFLGAKYAIPHMPPGSSLINLGSVHGMVHYATAPAYAAAKAGLVALTRQIAAEYGMLGIRANVIVPGLVAYERSGETLDEPSLQFYPLSRLTTPDDLADAVLFLISPAAKMITGASLVIDGGMTTRSPEWQVHAALDEDESVRPQFEYSADYDKDTL
ncbi:MAG: SDR family oxidoreductase [bacterium]|nr:SDR family oxidoreductase [bacterium]